MTTTLSPARIPGVTDAGDDVSDSVRLFVVKECDDHQPFLYDGDNPEAVRADNNKRAAFAALAVEAYWTRTFGTIPDSGEDFGTVIGDLFGDLMHLCDALGLDFADLVERGRGHYLPELAGEL